MTKQNTPETITDEDLDNVQGAGTAVGNPGKAADRKIILAEELETILTDKSGPADHKIAAQSGDGGI